MGGLGDSSLINSSTLQASFVKDTCWTSKTSFSPFSTLTHPKSIKNWWTWWKFLDDDFSGSGALGLTQIDRYFNDDSLTTMIQRIQSLSYHYEGRLQLHLIGGFSDNRRISHNLSIALLRKKITLFEKSKEFPFLTSKITSFQNSQKWCTKIELKWTWKPAALVICVRCIVME